jgi:hypothetical protein
MMNVGIHLSVPGDHHLRLAEGVRVVQIALVALLPFAIVRMAIFMRRLKAGVGRE